MRGLGFAVHKHQRQSGEATRRPLRLVSTSSGGRGPTSYAPAADAIKVKLSFSELTLIHKSLQALKTLGVHAQDELLDDTIQLVDLALNEAV
jgi:hypothetical protein